MWFLYLPLLLFPLVALYYWWREQSNVRESARRNVLYAPLPNLFWAVVRGQDVNQMIDQHVRKHNLDPLGMNMIFQYTIIVSEPELVQTVLVKQFTNFTNRRRMTQSDEILANILTVAEDEHWKRMRSVVTPTFTSGKLRQMKPHLNRTLQRLLASIDRKIEAAAGGDTTKQATLDLKQELSMFTMDTIIQAAFGIEIDAVTEPNHPIIVNASKVTQGSLNLRALISAVILFAAPERLKFLATWVADNSVVNFFNDLSSKIIEQKRAELKAAAAAAGGNNKTTVATDKAKNFIELLLESEAEGNEHERKYITNPEMVAQCLTFFLAGFDTTSSTMSLACYFLAANQEAQERLYEEVATEVEKMRDKGLDESDDGNDPLAFIGYDHLKRFPYLAGVIDETLRFYPQASVIERAATGDTDLVTADGRQTIHVKAGDIVQVPVYTLHHLEQYFREPKHFRPERFFAEEAATRPEFAYLPFGAGPRVCVAKSFALLQARLTLLYLVYHYKIGLDATATNKVPPEFNPQTFVPKALRLNFAKR